MKKSKTDFTDVVILAAGFMAGSAICNYLNTPSAYAGREVRIGKLVNCDEPFIINQNDWDLIKTLSPSAQDKAIRGLKNNYEVQCRKARIEQSHDDSQSEFLPGANFLATPHGHITRGPEIDPPNILSTYARSYAAKKAAAPAKGGAADSAPAAKTPAAAPASGGAGGKPGGKLPYPTTGKQWAFKDSGKSTRHYASGGSSGTTEWNATGMGAAANLMGVVYYTHPSSCSGGHGDEADIKMWGPAHSGGACCWCIMNINGAGNVCSGGEGPHPKTSKCKKVIGNVGSVKGKTVGLCHVITKGSGGAHSEAWIDTGGGFKKIGVFDGACGNSKTATTPNAAQQVQFRCDCSGVKIISATVYEISGTGGGGGGSAPSTPAAPAGKAPAAGKAKKAGAVYSYKITIA